MAAIKMDNKPNWKNEEDYSFVNKLNKEGLAWEFLKRNPKYRKDYEEVRAIYSEGESKYGSFYENEEKWRGFDKVAIKEPFTPHGDIDGKWNGRVFDKNTVPEWVYLEPYRAGLWGLKHEMADPDGSETPKFRYPYTHPKYITALEDIDDYLIETPPTPSINNSSYLAIGFDLSLPIDKQLDKAKDIIKTQRRARSIDETKNTPIDSYRATKYLRILDAINTEDYSKKKDIHKLIGKFIYGYVDSEDTHYDDNISGMKNKIEQAKNVMNKGYIRTIRDYKVK